MKTPTRALTQIPGAAKFAGFALLAATLFGGCAHHGTTAGGGSTPFSQGEEVPLVGDLKVERFRLDNGLKLLVVEDHSSPTIAYQTWFNVGSRDEVLQYTGLAHLFEHMMFLGTKNHGKGEYSRILETNGAEGENASTSQDYTDYVQELPSDKLDLIAGLESDRMVNLIVNKESFQNEREVVFNERRYREENSPDGTLYLNLFDLSYAIHPYKRPIIGFVDDLNRMVAQDAESFYKMYYSPNHATVVIVGDVKSGDALATVKKYYGSLQPHETPPHAIPAEPEQKSPRRKRVKLNIQVEKLMMAYHAPAVTSDDQAALNVLQSILSSGNSSRLHRALVETGMATGAYSDSMENKDPSLFIVIVGMQKGKRATQAESVVLREIAQLAKTPVSQAELERARNQLSYGFYESITENDDIARFLGEYETVGGSFEKMLAAFRKTQTVTAEEVQNVARKYLAPQGRNVVIGVPK